MIVVAVGGSVVVGGSQYFFQNFFQIRITVGVELKGCGNSEEFGRTQNKFRARTWCQIVKTPMERKIVEEIERER